MTPLSIPTLGDALGKALGSLDPLWALFDGVAAALKVAVPDGGPAIDQALADAKAKALAKLNEPIALAKLTEAKDQLAHLIDTGYSEAPPDPGDVVGG